MADIVPGAQPGELIVRDGDRVQRLYAAAAGGVTWVFHAGETYEVTEADDRKRTAHHHGALTAPMPATVVAVNVTAGDRVGKGQVLLVLEAMKMELPVRAPGDGTVAAVHCAPGDLVQPDVSLIDLE